METKSKEHNSFIRHKIKVTFRGKYQLQMGEISQSAFYPAGILHKNTQSRWTKASPIIEIHSIGSKPLDEAAWLGFSDILCCLLVYGAVGDGGYTFGALQGAIHKKLFTAVKKTYFPSMRRS